MRAKQSAMRTVLVLLGVLVLEPVGGRGAAAQEWTNALGMEFVRIP